MAGKHRIQTDTDEMDRVFISDHAPAQHRQGIPSLATASMILGLIGLFLGWLVFGFVSVIATVLGIAALKETERGDDGRLYAKVGLVTGIIGMFTGAIAAIAVFK